MVRAGAPPIPLNPASPLARLMDGPVRPGVVRWIGLRPDRHAPMQAMAEVAIDAVEGVVGDRWHGRPGGNRQVTLIGDEGLHAIARFLGRDSVAPEEVRRNLVVSGINLMALKERRVRVGSAVLEVTGECHPCTRMEVILGPGGYNAVRGQGGITARVVTAGMVRVGDPVERV